MSKTPMSEDSPPRNGRSANALSNDRGIQHSSIGRWALADIDRALRCLYILAGLAFVLSLLLFKPVLLGVFVGALAGRAIVLVAERLAEASFLTLVQSGDFARAMIAPGISEGRQVQIMRRLAAEGTDPQSAELAACYVSFCLDAGLTAFTTVIRTFEDLWGVEPETGSDESLVRRVLERGFRFNTPMDPPMEMLTEPLIGIPWADLWRHRRWADLQELHPGESLLRLLFRLYAAEWQSVLSPIWVIVALGTTVILSTHWLNQSTRGMFFYAMAILLSLSATWIAFLLRPGAFRDSLLAGDMDRCAHWVLESTEGKHFLVAALGSNDRRIREQAIRLLLWNDHLFTASITLPEGMRAFARKEGTRTVPDRTKSKEFRKVMEG